jgi:hypothetical protein
VTADLHKLIDRLAKHGRSELPQGTQRGLPIFPSYFRKRRGFAIALCASGQRDTNKDVFGYDAGS